MVSVLVVFASFLYSDVDMSLNPPSQPVLLGQSFNAALILEPSIVVFSGNQSIQQVYAHITFDPTAIAFLGYPESTTWHYAVKPVKPGDMWFEAIQPLKPPALPFSFVLNFQALKTGDYPLRLLSNSSVWSNPDNQWVEILADVGWNTVHIIPEPQTLLFITMGMIVLSRKFTSPF